MIQAADYWASVPTTIDGMLGGFAKISHTDIDGSNKLLKSLFKVGKGVKNPNHKKCLLTGGESFPPFQHLLKAAH